jgi:cytochrome P450 family 9
MFTIACVALILVLFYKWATANNDYFEKKGIAYKKPTFLIGTAGNMITQKMSTAESVIKSHLEMKHEKFVCFI